MSLDQQSPQRFAHTRRTLRRVLSSAGYHWTILFLTSFDVVLVLVELSIDIKRLSALCACTNTCGPPSRAEEVMEVVSDVINCLFILEPPLALLAFDLAYFSPRHHVLHLFDTFVVIVSFALIFVRPERSATTGTNGKEGQGSLASLVVVLRMWRLVKVVDEVAMGGEEMGEEARAEKQQRPQRKYGQVDALPPSEKRRRAAADSDSDASEP